MTCPGFSVSVFGRGGRGGGGGGQGKASAASAAGWQRLHKTITEISHFSYLCSDKEEWGENRVRHITDSKDESVVCCEAFTAGGDVIMMDEGRNIRKYWSLHSLKIFHLCCCIKIKDYRSKCVVWMLSNGNELKTYVVRWRHLKEEGWSEQLFVENKRHFSFTTCCTAENWTDERVCGEMNSFSWWCTFHIIVISPTLKWSFPHSPA